MASLRKERPWAALAVLVLPVLLIAMDSTILGFAVPQLSEAIEPSSSQLLWIIDIYSFVLAGLLVTMGVIGDRIGRRRLLMFGAAGFTVASIAAAFATGPVALIAARAALGVAGATLMPSTLSIIRNLFPDARRRQTAISVWAAAFGLGAAVGPILGGFLLEHFWWGSVFLVGAPVTAVLLVAAPRLVPESKDPTPGRFDPASAVLSIVTMLPFVYGVKMFAEHGLSIGATAGVAIGAVAGVAFVRRQHRLTDPMIDVTLFAVPRFRMAVSGNLVACVGLAGSMFAITQYLQLVVGMSPMRAGVQLLPAVAATITFTLLSPMLARRFGAFSVVTGGLVVGVAGFALLSQLTASSSIAAATMAILLVDAGLSAALTVSVDGIVAALPAERAGAGASVSETANELGMALGTAILGSILSAVYRSNLTAGNGVPADAVDHARETLGAAVTAADRVGGSAGRALLTAAQSAFADGMRVSAIVAAVLLTGVAVWAGWTQRIGEPTNATGPIAGLTSGKD